MTAAELNQLLSLFIGCMSAVAFVIAVNTFGK